MPNEVEQLMERPIAQTYMLSIEHTVHLAGMDHHLSQAAYDCHAASVACGWYSNLDHYKATGNIIELSRNIGEMYALMHSELSEAFEGNRINAMSTKIPDFTNEEEEMADTLIRIFDYAGAKGLRIGAAYVAKYTYNQSREDHKLENRAKAGGKKY